MKREKIELQEERNILTNLIVGDSFIKGIRPLLDVKLFESSYAKIVSRWIIEYFDKYKEAPKREIESIYRIKSQNIPDEDDSEIIGRFISRLSKEYEKKQNVPFSVDQAVRYLKAQSFKKLSDHLDEAVQSGDLTKAESLIGGYRRIETISSERVRLFYDHASVIKAFSDEDEVLFRFPKALGSVCGDFLRGDLIAFLAASNKGKTWWQWFCAETAVFRGLTSVFFTLEMPKNQMVRRGWQSLTASPKKDSIITLPRFIENAEERNKYFVETEEIERKKVNLAEVQKKQSQFRKLTRGGNIEIIALPSHVSTVNDIEAHLDNMYYYDNIVPDVIVIDYADIIASNNRREYRHGIDEIWKSLRSMAQRREALVVTASQADRSSFTKDAKEDNVAEDIRKYNHVSKMIVINQNKKEYEKGISRISQLKERDEKRSFQEAVVLNCLDIGRPCLDSRFKSEVIYDF